MTNDQAGFPPMRRQLNLKVLVGLVVVVLLLGIGLTFLYGFQVRRHAVALLVRADQAEEQEEVDRLTRYLKHYLVLKPDDDIVLERYALLLARHAHSTLERQRALAALGRVLRRHADRDGVRRWRVRLRMELG